MLLRIGAGGSVGADKIRLVLMMSTFVLITKSFCLSVLSADIMLTFGTAFILLNKILSAILSVCLSPVSYTHLTLPTNREV